MVLVVRILPLTRFFVVFTSSVFPALDLQRSDEIKHDIHPR